MERKLPQRKQTRLPDYDYSTAGYYFITLCAKDKRCIFGTVVRRGVLDAPLVELSDAGKGTQAALAYLNAHSARICVDKYVIMPNHLHMILALREDGAASGASGMPRPTNALIPQFISSLKRFTNRQSGQTLWQAGYYDHIIRNEADYLRIWKYIDENPAKWTQDRYYEA